MKDRNYNPLNEGYNGGKHEQKGYTGTNNNTSEAPQTLPPIQSAVVKPNNTQTPPSNNQPKNDSQE